MPEKKHNDFLLSPFLNVKEISYNPFSFIISGTSSVVSSPTIASGSSSTGNGIYTKPIIPYLTSRKNMYPQTYFFTILISFFKRLNFP